MARAIRRAVGLEVQRAIRLRPRPVTIGRHRVLHRPILLRIAGRWAHRVFVGLRVFDRRLCRLGRLRTRRLDWLFRHPEERRGRTIPFQRPARIDARLETGAPAGSIPASAAISKRFLSKFGRLPAMALASCRRLSRSRTVYTSLLIAPTMFSCGPRMRLEAQMKRARRAKRAGRALFSTYREKSRRTARGTLTGAI